MRRPLALACLAFIVTVMLILTFNPPPSFHSTVKDGDWCEIQGKVYEKERKEDVLYIYVKQVMPHQQSEYPSITQSKELPLLELSKESSSSQNSIIRNQSNLTNPTSQVNLTSQANPVNPINPTNQKVSQWVKDMQSIPDVQSSQELGGEGQPQGVLCLFTGTEEPRIGSRVRIRGKVSVIPSPTTPGEFDQRFYWCVQNIQMKMKDCTLLGESEGYDRWREGLFRRKEACERNLEARLPEKHASIMKAMLLGNKKELDGDSKELYQKNGISHMLAISGLHISIIGMGLYRILRKGYVKTGIAAIICVFLMYQYGLMTGMSSSAARAILMFLIQLFGKSVGRSYDMLTATMLAAVLIIMEQPLYVFYTGFQLSFGAILGIGLVYPVLQSHLGRYKKLQLLAVSFAISLTTMPAVLYAYYELPIYAVFLNLLVIPLLTILVMAGLLLMLLGGVSALMGTVLALPCIMILEFYEKLCVAVGCLPKQTWIVGKPELFSIVLFYLGLLFMVWMQEKMSGAYLSYLIMMAVCILTFRVHDNLKITFLDVGQGDGIVIENDNGQIYLVDGGSTSKKQIGKYQIIPFLKQAGISRIEAVFVSHPDEDHISGIRTLMEQSGENGITIIRLVLPDTSEGIRQKELSELSNLALKRNIEVHYITEGNVLRDGKLKITCVGPTAGIETGELNEISEVLLVEYVDFSLLLTGDTTGNEEWKMINRLENENINHLTILKVAHHGSRFSTPDSILEQTKPSYAIISSGRNNTYGHPHEELLERLEHHNIGWLRTDESGAILLKTDGKRMKLDCFLNSLGGEEN